MKVTVSKLRTVPCAARVFGKREAEVFDLQLFADSRLSYCEKNWKCRSVIRPIRIYVSVLFVCNHQGLLTKSNMKKYGLFHKCVDILLGCIVMLSMRKVRPIVTDVAWSICK